MILIEIPPLRERPEDIPILLHHFSEKFSRRFHGTNTRFDPAAMRALSAYTWPGNVRELANLVEGFHAMGGKGTVSRSDLPSCILDCKTPSQDDSVPSWDATEMEMIQKALRKAEGNKSRAAVYLGISRTRLYKKIKVYGIKA